MIFQLDFSGSQTGTKVIKRWVSNKMISILQVLKLNNKFIFFVVTQNKIINLLKIIIRMIKYYAWMSPYLCLTHE